VTASALLRTAFLAFAVCLGWLVPGFAHAGYQPSAAWLQRHDDLHVRADASTVLTVHTVIRIDTEAGIKRAWPGAGASKGVRHSATAMDTHRFQIIERPLPGTLERVVAMHAGYYSREHGMGEVFERKVADGLSEFLPRLLNPGNRLWLATSGGQSGEDGHIVGSIAIDGEDLGQNQAHLRWFILADGCRGQGVGAVLLKRAVAFADALGFQRTVLWTFKGLDAAHHLYGREGFLLQEEYSGMQWGVSLTEQRFVRESGCANPA
jgi:GNAT superfamily N-acetyltransferase